MEIQLGCWVIMFRHLFRRAIHINTCLLVVVVVVVVFFFSILKGEFILVFFCS